MAPSYKDHLAASVLNDGQIVNYRLLSRALKVHSNVAKQMLYEFHHSQNARKPKSVHATYLLAGVQKPEEPAKVNGSSQKTDEDTLMGDDSFMSSSAPQVEEPEDAAVEEVKVTTITLVREEHLEVVRKLYQEPLSIHVYSLQAGPLNNLHALGDCTRRVAAEHHADDLLETWKQYGTIHNPNAKRRQGRGPPPPAPTLSKTTTKTADKATLAKNEDDKPTSNQPAPANPNTKKPETKAPSLKRESSSIMAAFGKGKKAADSKAAVKAEEPAEDQPMLDADDEDEPAEPDPEESGEAKAAAIAHRKAQKEREDQLRSMMDAEDEDEDEGEDSKMDVDDEPTPVEDEPVDAPPPAPEPRPQDQQVTVSDGRRRGKRTVMKKKTTKDADGYLVTKEEAVFESFSESDTPAPSKLAMKQSTFGSAKSSSGAAKKGQGNIMSFFAKK